MSLDMRGIDSQRLLPQSLEDRLLAGLARVGGMLLLAMVAVVWLSLVSWSSTDPSLTHATTAPTQNWLGPLGAILSDLLLQTLGLSAVLTLAIPLTWGIALFRHGRIQHARQRVGFLPLAILAVASALATLPEMSIWPLNHGLGGVLGDGIFNVTSRVFAILNEERAGLAATLVLLAAAATTFTRSLGTDVETLVKAWLHRARTTDPAELTAALTGSLSDIKALAKPGRRWWPFARREAAAHAPDPAAYVDEPSLGMPRPPWQEEAHFGRGYPGHAAHAVEPHFDAHAAARHAYAGAHHPHAGSLSIDPGFAHDPAASAPHDAAEYAADFAPEHAASHFAPAFTPGFAPPPDDAHAIREPDFDLSTDVASQAIAARFAPGAADAPRPKVERPAPSAPPAASAPASPAKRAGGLFGRRAAEVESNAWRRPSLNLLKRPAAQKPNPEFTQTVMRGNARLLEDVLADFGVKGEVKDIRPGPVVTLYELEPARGTKSSRVIGLADDIARSMSVVSVRAAVVPGRNAIGLELPNLHREPVVLRELFEADVYRSGTQALPLAIGKSISGEPVVADLARMPHLLVAGTTGSGKSVGVNAMVLSLLYRHAPEDCRLLLIDPKMLELSVYNGIPHLLTPVVTDPQKAVAALNWAVGEMEERYKRMAAISVRNIDMFNNRVRNAKKRGEMLSRTVQTGFDRSGQAVFEKQKMDLEPLPHIVIVVDEFADLMAVAGKDVEAAVQRLAQMARAAGIHLIMATQRPSVDVITGTIKANFPTRISFKVTSKIDSRTILNEQGAEQLLGQGDMLFSTGAGQIIRVHGAFVSDEEVEAIAEALRRTAPANYVDGITDIPETAEVEEGQRPPSEGDLYDRAVAIVMRDRKASTSYLQRRLSIGYNRAADLIERMEREGLISPPNAVGKREILGASGGAADAA